MSPDPPRDNTSDNNELSNGGPHNFFVLNEDDIGEGDHELDFSSHESEMTSDDEEDMQNMNEAERENGHVRVRAQYQMLIPLANATETGDAGIQEFHQVDSPMGDDDDDNDVGYVDVGSHAALATEESVKEVTTHDAPKREIILSSEKVETIKDVMKNFTLPSTSIPIWAKEVSEDVWKSKLISKIETCPGASKTSGKS